MSFRPTDWAPLAEFDPLPGDPDAVFDEAARLRRLATGMTDQVARLRRVGAEESLVGASVAELRASALQVAGKLEKVADRYSKVSGILSSWAPELEVFQAATLKARTKALEAEKQLGHRPQDDLPNPGVFAYQVFHATGLGDTGTGQVAEALLAQARTDLTRVLEEAAARDRYWAHQIAHAIDDQLTDGFFDHIHQWVDRNKGWLDQLTDQLGWVTTIAAGVALLVPGLGEMVAGVELLEAAEAAATVGKVSAGVTLAAHVVEVSGGEKEARFDLGLDIFALGSLSAAGRLTRNLKHTAEATRDAAAQAAKHEAADEVHTTTMEAYQKVMADPTSTTEARAAVTNHLDTVDKRAIQASDTAEKGVLTAPEAKADLGHVLLAGDPESANAATDIEAMLAKHPGDEEVQRLAAHGRLLARAGKANFWTATTLDVADKTGAHKESWKQPYGEFKHWVATGSVLQ